MIVFFNVKITDIKMTWPYAGTVYNRAPWFPVSNRFDIFEYCLASRAVMAPLVDKYIFYIDLAEFADRQQELMTYIHSLFPPRKVEVHWHRIETTSEWREVTAQFTDDSQLIWYEGNDDHIFIDYNLDMIKAAQQNLKAEPDPYAVVYYSHWPEQMRMSLKLNGELTADGNFIKYNWETVDSIVLMKARRFKDYWLATDCGNDVIYRSDSLGWQYGLKMPSVVYAPTREIIRHYDGYSHVGKMLGAIAPPLYIPEGFFNGNMRVRIGYPDRKAGYQNLYSAAERLYSIDPNGVEARWTKHDIPLVWQGRINDWVININHDDTLLRQARNAAFLAMARIPLKAHGYEFGAESHPKEFFQKHLLTT